MRQKETNEIRMAIECKPIGRRPRSRSKKHMYGWSATRSRETRGNKTEGKDTGYCS